MSTYVTVLYGIIARRCSRLACSGKAHPWGSMPPSTLFPAMYRYMHQVLPFTLLSSFVAARGPATTGWREMERDGERAPRTSLLPSPSKVASLPAYQHYEHTSLRASRTILPGGRFEGCQGPWKAILPTVVFCSVAARRRLLLFVAVAAYLLVALSLVACRFVLSSSLATPFTTLKQWHPFPP